MKEKDINLTIQETEELCRLYLECRLSVLEERQLELVLSTSPFSTPDIDATRAMMGLKVPEAKARRSRFSRTALLSAAAVFAAVAIAVGFLIGSDSSTYEGFANGRILSPMQARSQALEQSKNADEIITAIDIMLLEKQLQYENFNKNLARFE